MIIVKSHAEVLVFMLCGYSQSTHEYTLVAETPEMYRKQSVTEFITQEVQKPSKQWVASIIEGTQERDEVVVRTAEFVLLPDTERVNRYKRGQLNTRRSVTPRVTLNWLSIVQDRSIRTLRDLTGAHIPMLKRMLEVCMYSIEKEAGIPQDQVMAYIHYPPSVYQLHVHFSSPYGQYYHRDAFRVHNLRSVIDNLELNPDYYRRITLYMAIPRQSMHCLALKAPEDPLTGPDTNNNNNPSEEKEALLDIIIKKPERNCPSTTRRCPQALVTVQPWSPSRAWSTLAA
jgi:hypothetical protein